MLILKAIGAQGLALSIAAFALQTEGVLLIPRNGIDQRSEARITDTSYVGYGHGKDFSDKWAIGTNHRRMASIAFTGCEANAHVTGLSVTWQDNHAPPAHVEETTTHGTFLQTGPSTKQISLAKDEFITGAYVATWQVKLKKWGKTVRHTRVGYVQMVTNKGQVLECGSRVAHGEVFRVVMQLDIDETDPTLVWGDGRKALLYLSGSSGDALDALQGHFIPAEDF